MRAVIVVIANVVEEKSLERAKERYPGVKPRVISDNGPQFIAKDFKEFIRSSGMTHARTSHSPCPIAGRDQHGHGHDRPEKRPEQ